jgi:hypothetical protein
MGSRRGWDKWSAYRSIPLGRDEYYALLLNSSENVRVVETLDAEHEVVCQTWQSESMSAPAFDYFIAELEQ